MTIIARRALAAALTAAVLVPAAAIADSGTPGRGGTPTTSSTTSSGGAGLSGPTGASTAPVIDSAACAAQGERCHHGDTLTMTGTDLASVRHVVFIGRSGHRDARSAKPIAAADGSLSVLVPAHARSGPVRAVAANGSTPAGTVTIVSGPPSTAAPGSPGAPAIAGGVFPISGAHTFGLSATNRFGGRRGHQGQDVFAACGTPLISPRAGTVTQATFEARAGNYVVITDTTGESEVYMHMQGPAIVAQGATVVAGEPIGAVGDTGDAQGCHLHFELWTAPGWYRGGHPIDPLATLRAWDRRGGRRVRLRL